MNDAPSSTPSRSQAAYWTCQLAGWGLYTAARLYAAVAVLNLPWARATVELVLLSGAGLGLTHLLREYMSRHRWSALRVPKLAWRIVVAGFILGTPLGLLTPFTSISVLQDPGPVLNGIAPAYGFHGVPPLIFPLNILNWSVLFMTWLAIYFTVLKRCGGTAGRNCDSPNSHARSSRPNFVCSSPSSTHIFCSTH